MPESTELTPRRLQRALCCIPVTRCSSLRPLPSSPSPGRSFAARTLAPTRGGQSRTPSWQQPSICDGKIGRSSSALHRGCRGRRYRTDSVESTAAEAITGDARVGLRAHSRIGRVGIGRIACCTVGSIGRVSRLSSPCVPAHAKTQCPSIACRQGPTT